jgi:hypothetical protein
VRIQRHIQAHLWRTRGEWGYVEERELGAEGAELHQQRQWLSDTSCSSYHANLNFLLSKEGSLPSPDGGGKRIDDTHAASLVSENEN